MRVTYVNLHELIDRLTPEQAEALWLVARNLAPSEADAAAPAAPTRVVAPVQPTRTIAITGSLAGPAPRPPHRGRTGDAGIIR
ncbi:MAG TPA: hypothetical protein VF444_12055 [Pseudonocardiaceae bacterium]